MIRSLSVVILAFWMLGAPAPTHAQRLVALLDTSSSLGNATTSEVNSPKAATTSQAYYLVRVLRDVNDQLGMAIEVLPWYEITHSRFFLVGLAGKEFEAELIRQLPEAADSTLLSSALAAIENEPNCAIYIVLTDGIINERDQPNYQLLIRSVVATKVLGIFVHPSTSDGRLDELREVVTSPNYVVSELSADNVIKFILTRLSHAGACLV